MLRLILTALAVSLVLTGCSASDEEIVSEYRQMVPEAQDLSDQELLDGIDHVCALMATGLSPDQIVMMATIATSGDTSPTDAVRITRAPIDLGLEHKCPEHKR